MTTFHYKAIASSGDSVEGKLDARDQQDAVNQLHEMGYVPVRADEIGRESRSRRRSVSAGLDLSVEGLICDRVIRTSYVGPNACYEESVRLSNVTGTAARWTM